MIRWLFFLLFATGCTVRVVQFINDDANFRSYRSYALLGLKGQNVSAESENSELLQRIEKFINAEMARRDYQINDNPDLVLRYEIVSSTQTESRNTNPYLNPYYYPPSYRTITESIILLEMTDYNTKKLVWQASLDLREHNKITKRKDALQVAITNIFNTYLYRAGSRTPDQSLFVK